MIQVYTGEGKGKTTAALGLAIRAFGAGKKVAIVYFDKGGEHYSEREVLDKLGIVYYATGLDRINHETGEFRFGVTEEDKNQAIEGLAIAQKLLTQCDLLILDEINSTVALGMLPRGKILELIKNKPENLELVLTGRNCPEDIKKRADLITEMSLVKHYYYDGFKARKGIEF